MNTTRNALIEPTIDWKTTPTITTRGGFAMTIARVLILFVCAVLASTAASAQSYDLLVIAPWDFVDELQPLISWKIETGRPATIVTLGQIEEIELEEYRDQPEKIKMFIADFVQQHNVRYVMLVGDSDRFPVRYIKAYNTEWGTSYFPSDLYYMDLFDSNGDFDDWDGNDNGDIGEMDFAGGTDISMVNLDDIDMVPDVAAARIPASTEAEVTRYVNKVIDYESSAHMSAWFRNAALIVDGGADRWGSTTKMDGVVKDLPGSIVHKLYRDVAPYQPMNDSQRAAEITSLINSGVGLISYHGHGNRLVWDDWYLASDLTSLTNSGPRLPIVFASACLTGRFHFEQDYYMDRNGSVYTGGSTDAPEPMAIQPSLYDAHNDESMAEHMLVRTTTGAVAYIGATEKAEFGVWLARDRGLNPYFYEAYGRGGRVLGDLWTTALTRFVSDVKNPKDGGMHYYQFIHLHKMILFGDPSLAIPQMPTVDVRANGQDGPLTLSSGVPASVTVELDAGSLGGSHGDWWILHDSPSGMLTHIPGFGLWLPGFFTSYQGPLVDIGTTPILHNNLQSGVHHFYFGVDLNPNGAIDFDTMFWDEIEIVVQ